MRAAWDVEEGKLGKADGIIANECLERSRDFVQISQNCFAPLGYRPFVKPVEFLFAAV